VKRAIPRQEHLQAHFFGLLARGAGEATAAALSLTM